MNSKKLLPSSDIRGRDTGKTYCSLDGKGSKVNLSLVNSTSLINNSEYI